MIKSTVAILVLMFVPVFNTHAMMPKDDIFKTPVSLSADNMTLMECLKEVCLQAGVEFAVDAELLRSGKLNLDTTTTIEFRDILLSEAINKLVRFERNPGVLPVFWKGKIELISLRTWTKRRFEATPEWLKRRVVDLDSDGQVKTVYLRYEDDDEYLKRVLELPAIQEINIRDGRSLTIAGLRAIADCRVLKSFTMNNGGRPANPESPWTADEALEAIAGSTTLEEITADNCGIGDAGVQHLSGMTSLRRLSLRQNQIKDAGLEAIGQLTDLVSLDLGCYVSSAVYGRNELTDSGLQHLKGLARLEQLGVEGTGISKLSLDLPNLRSLTIGSSFSGDPGPTDEMIRSLTRFKQLRNLSVNSGAVTDEGLSCLAEIPTIRSIELDCSEVSDRGVSALVSLPLESLSLRRIRLTNEGLLEISKISSLKRLSIAGDISGTTVDGFKQLEPLNQLRELTLYGFTGTGDYQGFGDLKQLKSLFFEGADIGRLTQTELDKLGQALPDTRIFVGTGAGIYQPRSQTMGKQMTIPVVPGK